MFTDTNSWKIGKTDYSVLHKTESFIIYKSCDPFCFQVKQQERNQRKLRKKQGQSLKFWSFKIHWMVGYFLLPILFL